MRQRIAHATRRPKSPCRQVSPAARAAPAPTWRRSARRSRRSYPRGSASAEQVVERRTLLLLLRLIDGLNEVIIELAHDGVEPAPIVGYRLKDDGTPVAPYSGFLAFEAKVF